MLAKSFLAVGIFIVVGVLFYIITLLAAWVFRPFRPSAVKESTYECGEVPVGPAWMQFRVGYYIYALIFLIFDVEAMYVFPWAAALKTFAADPSLALLAMVDMIVFVVVLGVGLAYAWKKGVLVWR